MANVIYLSGSISGGREDIDIYCEIADRLTECGVEVFAGDVTNRNSGVEGAGLRPAEIFERDMKWLEEVARRGGSLVAEISRPSTGVGYEIAAARYLHRIPVICLWRPRFTSRCTAMIEGDGGITLLQYSEENLAEMVERLFRRISRGGE